MPKIIKLPKTRKDKLNGQGQISPIEQAITLLLAVKTEDILQLMLPGAVQDSNRRLAQIDTEMHGNDQELAQLYARRDEILAMLATSASAVNTEIGSNQEENDDDDDAPQLLLTAPGTSHFVGQE